MYSIKALETPYKGYRFRSRLEARYAVFFDTLSIVWEYEKEGYLLEDTTPYLPDFYFPDFGVHGEVKSSLLTFAEYQKIHAVEGIIFDGWPAVRLYALAPSICPDKRLPAAVRVHADFTAYKAGVSYGCIELLRSQYKKRLWYAYGEGIETYDTATLRQAVYAARSARFEHGRASYVR